MENQSSQAKIDELIEKINYFHSNILKKTKGEISEIEKEMVLSSLKELYEQVLFLNSSSSLTQEKKKSETSHTPQKSEKKPIIITEQFTEKQPAQKETTQEIPKEEPLKKTLPIVKKEVSVSSQTNQSLHEKFKKDGTNMSERLGSKPINDLKSAIALNQRFSFINELFAKNTVEFDNAIKQLNNSKTMEEANNHINSHLKTKFKWDEKSGTVKIFMELVKRKFLKS